MKSAQERLQALEAERLILRNQLAIADKYQLDLRLSKLGKQKCLSNPWATIGKISRLKKQLKGAKDLKQEFPDGNLSKWMWLSVRTWVGPRAEEPVDQNPLKNLPKVPWTGTRRTRFDDAYYASLEVQKSNLLRTTCRNSDKMTLRMQP